MDHISKGRELDNQKALWGRPRHTRNYTLKQNHGIVGLQTTRMGTKPVRFVLFALCLQRAQAIVSNKKAESQEQSRQVRKEMARHSVDCSEVTVMVTHGVVQLHGRIRPMKGHEGSFDEAISGLLKGLQQRQGIREVITYWTRIL